MDVTDVAVIGGGVVGLAVASRLATERRVVLIERHARFATETSGRNSGVIHAGLYYPPGSAKARLCRRGHDLLYAYCAERGVEHRRTGKLVVACSDTELDALEALRANALACGVEDIEMLDARALAAREPSLRGVAALYSPSTGIVDALGLSSNLLWQAKDAGCDVVSSTELIEVEATSPRYRLVLRESMEPSPDSKPTRSSTRPACRRMRRARSSASTWTRRAFASLHARATTSSSRARFPNPRRRSSIRFPQGQASGSI